MWKFLKTRNVSVIVWNPSPFCEDGRGTYKWNRNFYITRKLIKQMEPNFACEGFWRQEMFLLWFENPPSSGRGILTQMKHKFLHNSKTYQANGAKFGMWKFLKTKNVSVMVWDPSPFCKDGRGSIQMKQKFPHNSKTNQVNGVKFGMWKFLKTRNVSVIGWDPSPFCEDGRGAYKWNRNFHITRKLIK